MKTLSDRNVEILKLVQEYGREYAMWDMIKRLGDHEYAEKQGKRVNVVFSKILGLLPKEAVLNWRQAFIYLLEGDCPPNRHVDCPECEDIQVCRDCWKDWYAEVSR